MQGHFMTDGIGENGNNSTPFKGEVFRKLIHYSSASIPIGYLYVEKNTVLLILGILLALLFLIEFIKYKSDFIYSLYVKYFKDMLREHEYDRKKFRINGASWVLFSAIFCIILFPKLIAITGLLMLSFADSTSALAGRLWGKKQFAPNRSYIGTIAFFIVGIFIVLFAPKYFGSVKEYALVFIALLVTTTTDAMSLPVDDNFTIPVVCCSVMYLLYFILYPNSIII
jgi:dolichol kinase